MRLIDADAMLARLEEWNTSDSIDKALYNFTLDRIIEQPTIEPEKRIVQIKLSEEQIHEAVEKAKSEIVQELPSAQPEIIRCKDCEWWMKQKDSIQGRCDLMQMYPTGGWFCGNAQERRTDE